MNSPLNFKLDYNFIEAITYPYAYHQNVIGFVLFGKVDYESPSGAFAQFASNCLSTFYQGVYEVQ